jgi:two-component system sensor histidine kinase KdpD
MDRGPGLPEKEKALIFNKFYRIGGSKPGGTGLGLSIAKGFVEAHRGWITVENRSDGGALFTISLPVETYRENINN